MRRRTKARPGGQALRDRALDRRLTREGWVKVAGYAADDVAHLRAVFDATHETPGDQGSAREDWREDPAPGVAFMNGLELPFEQRDVVEEQLADYWARVVPDLFVDHEPVLTTYLMKSPGPSQLTMHQDPSFVDERRARSLTVWIALDDADLELDNGPLYVVPRSHVLGDEYRGTCTPSTYLEFLPDVWEHAVPLEVEAGDVLVVDGRVIHGSPPNRTDRLRLAVVAPVVPRGSQLIHAVGLDQDRVAILEVDDDFYRRTSPRRLIEHPPDVPDDAPVRPRARVPYERSKLG